MSLRELHWEEKILQKCYILHDSIYFITEGTNYRSGEQISGCQQLDTEGGRGTVIEGKLMRLKKNNTRDYSGNTEQYSGNRTI